MSERAIQLIDQARRAKDPSLLARAIPYMRFLGVDAELRDDAIVCVMRHSDDLIGNKALPALHGGVLGTLMESAAIFQVVWSSETLVLPKTINITIDYLRSAGPVDTFASAQVNRLGRRVAHVQAYAWQGQERDRPVAVAHANFALESAPK